MYTATFTFAKLRFDDAFHALDAVIAQVAKSVPGYLGEEAWENPSSGLVSTVYYCESMEALQQLMKHPAHPAPGRMAQRLPSGDSAGRWFVRRREARAPAGQRKAIGWTSRPGSR